MAICDTYRRQQIQGVGTSAWLGHCLRGSPTTTVREGGRISGSLSHTVAGTKVVARFLPVPVLLGPSCPPSECQTQRPPPQSRRPAPVQVNANLSNATVTRGVRLWSTRAHGGVRLSPEQTGPNLYRQSIRPCLSGRANCAPKWRLPGSLDPQAPVLAHWPFASSSPSS